MGQSAGVLSFEIPSNTFVISDTPESKSRICACPIGGLAALDAVWPPVFSDGVAMTGDSSGINGRSGSMNENGSACSVVDGGGDGRLDRGDAPADGVDG